MEKVENGSNFKWGDEIKRIYYTTKEAGSYSNPLILYRILKKKDTSCTLKKVREWLREQSVYNLHRFRKLKFERRKIVRLRPYETLTSDIIFLQDLSKYNSGFAYILTIVCLFSNKAWAFPMKKKTKKSTSEGLEKVLVELRGRVMNLWTDDGGEYMNLDIYDKYNVNRYSVNSPLKCSHIEIFNKSLENRLFRVMTSKCTLRWIDYLNDVIESWNNTPSSRLYYASPNQAVVTPYKEMLQKKFREEREKMSKKYKNKKIDIKENDTVFVVKPKTIFSRGYKSNFNDKTKKVEKVFKTSPPTFKLTGLKRLFYRNEIAPTIDSEIENKQDKQYYFIVKKRVFVGRELRAYRSRVGQQYEYLIRSHSDPDCEEWVSEKQPG